MIYCVSRINTLRTGNCVRIPEPRGAFLIGEKNGEVTERLLELQALLGVDFHTVISENIVLDIWRKFMFNSACNTIEAIVQGNHSWFQNIPEACDAMECIMQEILRLAQKMGIGLTQQDIRDLDGVFHQYASDGICSMAQDVAQGRQSEIDMFMGEAMRLGAKYHVDMPVCRFVYDLVVCRDKINLGL